MRLSSPHFKRCMCVVLSVCVCLLILHSFASCALRNQFDSIEIGMPEHKVVSRLGRPNDHSTFVALTPTHATFSELVDGVVHHTVSGPEAKNYWLYLAVDEQSAIWSNDRKQIIVNYDSHRRVMAKYWLEERRSWEEWTNASLWRLSH